MIQILSTNLITKSLGDPEQPDLEQVFMQVVMRNSETQTVLRRTKDMVFDPDEDPSEIIHAIVEELNDLVMRAIEDIANAP